MAIAHVASELFEEVSDFLASGPTPEQIIAYKVSEALDERLHYLLDLNSQGEIGSDERAELEEFLRINHLLRMIKLKAQLNLAGES